MSAALTAAPETPSTSAVIMRHTIEAWDLERHVETLREEVQQSLDESRRSKLYCQQVRKELQDLVATQFGVSEEDHAVFGGVAMLLSNTTTLVQKFAIFETYLREKFDAERRSQRLEVLSECRAMASSLVSELREDVRGTLISFKSEIVGIQEKMQELLRIQTEQGARCDESLDVIRVNLQTVSSDFREKLLLSREALTKELLVASCTSTGTAVSAAVAELRQEVEQSRDAAIAALSSMETKVTAATVDLKRHVDDEVLRTTEDAARQQQLLFDRLEAAARRQDAEIRTALQRDVVETRDILGTNVAELKSMITEASKDNGKSVDELQRRLDSTVSGLSSRIEALQSQQRRFADDTAASVNAVIQTARDDVSHASNDMTRKVETAVEGLAQLNRKVEDQLHSLQATLAHAFDGDHHPHPVSDVSVEVQPVVLSNEGGGAVSTQQNHAEHLRMHHRDSSHHSVGGSVSHETLKVMLKSRLSMFDRVMAKQRDETRHCQEILKSHLERFETVRQIDSAAIDAKLSSAQDSTLRGIHALEQRMSKQLDEALGKVTVDFDRASHAASTGVEEWRRRLAEEVQTAVTAAAAVERQSQDFASSMQVRVENVQRTLVSRGHRSVALLLAARTQSFLRLRYWRLWQASALQRKQTRLHHKHVAAVTHVSILQRTTTVQATAALRRRYWATWKRFVVACRGKQRLRRLSHSLRSDAVRRVLVRYFKSWIRWATRRRLRSIATQRMSESSNKVRSRYFISWAARARCCMRRRNARRMASILSLMYNTWQSSGALRATQAASYRCLGHSDPQTPPHSFAFASSISLAESRLLSPQRRRESFASSRGSFSGHTHPSPSVNPRWFAPRETALLQDYFRKWTSSIVHRIRHQQSDALRGAHLMIEQLRAEFVKAATESSADRTDVQLLRTMVQKMFFGGTSTAELQPSSDAGADLARVLGQLQEGYRSVASLMDLYVTLARWLESSEKEFSGIHRDFRGMQAWMTAVDEELRRVQKFVRPPFK